MGKVAVSQDIPNTREPLSEENRQELQKHSEAGYRTLAASNHLSHLADDVFSIHENGDGTGYPRGVKGEDIPLLARIVAAADAFDVLHYGGRPEGC